jgi:hypothetical protein
MKVNPMRFLARVQAPVVMGDGVDAAGRAGVPASSPSRL